MLIKAIRCGNGKDLYKPAASILKTLYRDEDNNYRDVRPEDTVHLTNQWDYLQDERSKFFYGDIDTPENRPTEVKGSWPSNLFYNEADALEDEVLFPEERAEEASKAQVAVGKKDSLRAFEEEEFSMKRFVDGTWNWESEDSDNSGDPYDSEDGSECSHESAIDDDGDDEFEDLDDEYENIDDLYPKDFPEELWPVVHRLALEKTYKDDFPNDDLQGEFMKFMEKTSSRSMISLFRLHFQIELTPRTDFKKAWHQADCTPNGQERYLEMKKMTHKSWKYNHTRRPFFKASSTVLQFQVLSWLKVTSDDVKDVEKALGKIYPFFNAEFLDSEEGEKFKDSLIFNQEERAKYYPDIRTDKSTALQPKEFYADFDKYRKQMKFSDDYAAFPLEWDMKVRPIIAKRGPS